MRLTVIAESIHNIPSIIPLITYQYQLIDLNLLIIS